MLSCINMHKISPLLCLIVGGFRLQIFLGEKPQVHWIIIREWKTTQQTAGWKDGQTLFHRTLSATARGPTSTTAVDWHLKVKDIVYDVGLTKNYCLTVSIQKIISIHELILQMQQILGSHELNGHAHFWPYPPKNYWNNF